MKCHSCGGDADLCIDPEDAPAESGTRWCWECLERDDPEEFQTAKMGLEEARSALRLKEMQ